MEGGSSLINIPVFYSAFVAGMGGDEQLFILFKKRK